MSNNSKSFIEAIMIRAINNFTFSDLAEFSCLQENSKDDEKFFNRERTLALIEFYKKYKPRVGCFEVKTMKKLWELVARDMSNMYKVTVSATKCENRYKVLERNYKKTVDNNNQTGRAKKNFEFEPEMDELFCNKSNIRPRILLSSNETISPVISGPQDSVENVQIELSIPENQENGNKSLQRRKRRRVENTQSYKKRNDLLNDMRNDLKQFYEGKLKLEKEKMDLAQKKLEDQQKRTLLLEEQVSLLKATTK